MSGLLVYGANGYTGALVAREAVRRGLAPVVAGRNAAAIGRLAGQLGCVGVEHAFRTRDIDFGSGMKSAVTIPWGDVSTAYYTTGIPNIEVYIPMSSRQIAVLRRLNRIAPLLRLGVAGRLLGYSGPGGYRTPSQLMGSGFVETLPGSSRIEITAGRAWTPRPA